MRLLNTENKTLSSFSESIPRYAVLSHTWSLEEVTLQEVQTLNAQDGESPPHPIASKAGYRKIQGCCDLAKRDGFDWVWIDTCCIDKTSSVELSEAINSMFQWYRESSVCYVYLEDVSNADQGRQGSPVGSDGMAEFRESRWFTRGWTLQELVAPVDLRFFNNSWSLIGSRLDLKDVVGEITRIPTDFLIRRPLSQASLAQRMSWAARRSTSRKEDVAYCLLGLFEVHMPLLYGKGAENAFRRLQEEIIKGSEDQSILAWGFGLPAQATPGEFSILAKSPSDFAACGSVIPCSAWKPFKLRHFEITKTGLHIELPITGRHFGILNCRLTHDFSNLIAIPLSPQVDRDGAGLFVRKTALTPTLYDESKLLESTSQVVFINMVKSSTDSTITRLHNSALIQFSPGMDFTALDIDPRLEYAIEKRHIHVSFSSITDCSHSSKTAYFQCRLVGLVTEPVQREDFVVKLQFSKQGCAWWQTPRVMTILEFFSPRWIGLIMKRRLDWKVQCSVAPSAFLPFSRYDGLAMLNWKSDIICGDFNVRARVRVRTMLGSRMANVTLGAIPLDQNGLARFYLDFLSRVWHLFKRFRRNLNQADLAVVSLVSGFFFWVNTSLWVDGRDLGIWANIPDAPTTSGIVLKFWGIVMIFFFLFRPRISFGLWLWILIMGWVGWAVWVGILAWLTSFVKIGLVWPYLMIAIAGFSMILVQDWLVFWLCISLTIMTIVWAPRAA